MLLALILVIALATSVQYRPAAAQGGTTHTVQPGENLFRIALRYGFTTDYLATVNGIADPTRIYVGQVLTIPDTSAPPAPAPANPEPAPAPAANPLYHTVQRGENLSGIARAYSLSWTDLATANGLTDPSRIYAGQQLIIPGAAAAPAASPAPAAAQPAPATGQRTHVVQRGEHLSAIARAYGVTWPALAAVNNITNPNHIYAGQTLVIPDAATAAAYAQPAAYAPAAPAPTITSGKQIIVDLSDQRVYAYENGQLVRNVLVSTGLWGTPTVTGNFSIYTKYDSQLMSGPGYYLPGVPWVMYFYRDYSLHGTYWHSNFGQPMSHGCVNMPTPEAAWLYQWAPIGTSVRVQA
ncbi:MAG: LysM peptidoglycan-binding domain-containing protein [Chloroflexota bacterium]